MLGNHTRMTNHRTRMKRNYEFSCLKLGIMKYELLFKYVTSIGKNMSINHKYLATKGKDHESGQIIPTMARVCDTKVIIPVQSYIFKSKIVYSGIKIFILV